MSDLTRRIEYEADGVRMAGLYVKPRVGPADGARRPGILVSPPGPGLGDHSKGVAQRLAEAGYAAFALDYHGGGALISDAAEMMARIRGFIENPLSIRARVAKALEVLAAAARGRRRAHRRDRVLFRRHRGARAGPQRRTGRRDGRFSQRSEDDAAAGCRKHQRQDTGLPGRGRSPDSAGRSRRVRGGDAPRRGRLADASLRRRPAQLHRPRRR